MGIIHQTLCVDIPLPNGIIEIKNNFIHAIAALMLQRKVPKSFEEMLISQWVF